MAFDVAAFLALFAFAWLGAHRGPRESAIRLVGLAFAYGVSLLAARFAGAPLAAALASAPWVGLAAAGMLGFFAAQALVELAARKARAARGEASDLGRAAGALIGIARGGLLLLPVLWLAGFAESVRTLNPAAPLPDLSGARSARIGQAAIGGALAGLARSEAPVTRMTAKWIAEPGESVAALGALAADPRLRVLQADQSFWRDLAAGNVESALARPTFAELARDANLRGQFADLGLVAEGSALDAQQFHDEMAAVMADVAPRIQRLQSDPAFQALLADPEIRARILAGDTAALLADPRILQLAAAEAR